MALGFSSGLLGGLRNFGQGGDIPADPNQRNVMQQYGVTNPLLQQFGQSVGMLAGRDMRSNAQIQKATVAPLLAQVMKERDPQKLREIAGQLSNVDPKMALQVAQMADKIESDAAAAAREANKPTVLAEGSQIVAPDGTIIAENVKPEKKPALSTYGQMLVEQGLSTESPEFKAAMARRTEMMASGIEKTVQVKTPMEQVSFLNEQFTSTPMYTKGEEVKDKITKAKSALPAVLAGKSEGIAVFSRMVSEAYNADTRAASEIDRFLSNKGILRAFPDWVKTVTTGDVTDETKANMAELLGFLTEQRLRNRIQEVNNIAESYSDFTDVGAMARFKEVNLKDDIGGMKLVPLSQQPPRGKYPDGAIVALNGKRFKSIFGVLYEIPSK